ncbi:MAG: sulfate/molybdate ABC transporter ATP-binding protein [Anaerovoracaceae bacterium]|jgi:molybdate transport system ATP-binding protein
MSLQVDIRKHLPGFSLEVSFDTAGEWQGVLGASGCGKSMTLKMIAGIVTPDEGRIVLGDRILFDSERRIDLRPQQRSVGYLFQNYALFPSMTVRENILCGVRDGETKRVDELMETLELAPLAGRYPSQLSGGQQQRAALARCLAGKPEAMLLDEPFSALDEYLKERLQQDIKRILSAYPGEVILVSHNRDEVYRFCKRIAILDDGHVVAAGDLQEVFDDPRQVTAARLSGCKNISGAQKMGPHRVKALDWGLELETERTVPDDLGFIGIRAHDIEAGGGKNRVPVSVLEVREELFETNVIFASGRGELWWKLARDDWRRDHLDHVPQYISLPPDKIMLLSK